MDKQKDKRVGGRSLKFRNNALNSIQTTVLGILILWTALEDPSSQQKLGLLAVTFFLALIGIYLMNIYIQSISIAIINITFILNSLSFNFSLLNVSKLVIFQTVTIFLYESFWFTYQLRRFDAETSSEKARLRDISWKFLTSLLTISLLSLLCSIGMLYLSLQSIVFLPSIFTVIAFALIVLFCIGLIQFVRKHAAD